MAILVRAGALDSLIPNRRALEERLAWEASADSTRCMLKDDTVAAVNGLPCTFDWGHEIPQEGVNARMVGRKPNKTLKLLDPPKRCTVACRQYRKPAELDPGEVAPHTPDDNRAIEKELFGVWLSSTPFDRVPEATLLAADSASDVEAGEAGEYLLVAVIGKVDRRATSDGRPMARVDLITPDGTLDVVVWDETLRKYGKDLRPDALVAVPVLKKNRNGNWSHQLTGVAPI